MTLPRINTGTYDKMAVREQYRTHLRLIQKSHPAIVAVSGLDHPPGGFLFPEWVAFFTGIRNFASRLIYGARLTLGVGLAATAVNVLVALVVGGVSGFVGGRLDLTVQRFVDAWMSIPGLLILLTVMSVVGRGVLQIIVVLGGIGASRVVRGAVIGAKENAYFEAARAVGSSRWRTLVHHLLPNIAPVLIVIYSINIGAVVISEASLSFLGFGLPTTVPNWGGMLSREGRQYMEIAPRLAVWPGLCLTVVVYSLNMFGDAVRDLLDPRLRGGSGRLGAYGAQAVGKAGATPPPARR